MRPYSIFIVHADAARLQQLHSVLMSNVLKVNAQKWNIIEYRALTLPQPLSEQYFQVGREKAEKPLNWKKTYKWVA